MKKGVLLALSVLVLVGGIMQSKIALGPTAVQNCVDPKSGLIFPCHEI